FPDAFLPMSSPCQAPGYKPGKLIGSCLCSPQVNPMWPMHDWQTTAADVAAPAYVDGFGAPHPVQFIRIGQDRMFAVIPAKAGIQWFAVQPSDSRFRVSDSSQVGPT